MKNSKEQRRCQKSACFANILGICDVLDPADDGYGTDDGHGGIRPCPFYKTKDDAESGRIEALERLKSKGRFDLIQKYRLTLEQTGVLNAGKAEDSFFDAHSADIEELQRLAYIEQEIRNGRVIPSSAALIGEQDEWDDAETGGDDAVTGVDDAETGGDDTETGGDDTETGGERGGLDDS